MEQKDQRRNATYTLMIGRNTAEKSNVIGGKSLKYVGGDGGGGAGEVNTCKYKEYGRGRKFKHKNSCSQYCDSSGINHSIIGM